MYAASWQRWAGACAWGQTGASSVTAARTTATTSWRPPAVGTGGQRRPAGRRVAAGAGCRVRAAAVGAHRPPSGPVSRRSCWPVRCWPRSPSAPAPSPPGSVAASSGRSPLLWLSTSGSCGRRHCSPGSPSARAAGAPTCIVLLALGTPLVAACLYAVGPYDAQPVVGGDLRSAHRDRWTVPARCRCALHPARNQDDADAVPFLPPLADGAGRATGAGSRRYDADQVPWACARRPCPDRSRRLGTSHLRRIVGRRAGSDPGSERSRGYWRRGVVRGVRVMLMRQPGRRSTG